MATYPLNIEQDIRDAVLTLPEMYADHVRGYRGEFIDYEAAVNFGNTVRAPMALTHLESIEKLTDEDDSTKRTPKDRLTFYVYCASSNYQSLDAAANEALEIAAKVRSKIAGRKVSGVSGTSEGVFDVERIVEEITMNGISVYTVTVTLDVAHDLDTEATL